MGARARRGAGSGACARRRATGCAGKGAPPARGDLGASLGDSCTRGRLRHARAGGAGARPRGRDFGRSGWEMGSGSRAHTRVARPPRAAPWAGRGRHAQASARFALVLYDLAGAVNGRRVCACRKPSRHFGRRVTEMPRARSRMPYLYGLYLVRRASLRRADENSDERPSLSLHGEEQH